MTAMNEVEREFRLFVLKRDSHTVQPFDRAKVMAAIEKADKEVGSAIGFGFFQIAAEVETLCREFAESTRVAGERTIMVEEIQDIVERVLMQDHAPVAKAYILYRAKQAEKRERTPISNADAEAIRRNRLYFPAELQLFQLVSKYAKWLPGKRRRETWEEVVDRVMDFLRWQVIETLGLPNAYSEAEWEEMRQAMLHLEALPSMRLVQMAGPAAKRCNVSIYNCSFHGIDSIEALVESLYILMQGTGSGFSTEYDWVEELPKINRQKGGEKIKVVVEDSTEGWCDAYKACLCAWFGGDDVDVDVSGVRPAGVILKTKGGRASGPGPFLELLEFARKRILARQGRRLRSIDVHDIECMCGKIVQVGGVRRAARIGFSDLDDELLRTAKVGAFWDTERQRTMANNSAVYHERPDDLTFMREWLNLAASGSGERGIWNVGSLDKTLPKRRKRRRMRGNPCGEVNLLDGQFCNLSIAVVRANDTAEGLVRKVRIAARFGTIQSTMTSFRYLRDKWKKNCEEERLLGVDLIGASDNPLMQYKRYGPGRQIRRDFLLHLKDVVTIRNEYDARRLGINPSAAATVIKPSGNSSVLLDCGNTITGRFAMYQIRRVRCNSIDPVCKLLIDAGVPHHPEYDDPNPKNPAVWVFEFPWRAPNGAVTKDDMNAIDQLENWLDFKKFWTEHNPSATIYVGKDEWMEVGAWVLRNWDWVGGLSFLPRSDHVYPLAPNEAISKDKYEELVASFPVIPWEKLSRYEDDDQTTGAQEFACTGGTCELAA